MPRIHPYPPEFRTEAMHLAQNSEQLLPALAGDLVHSQRTWLGMWDNRTPSFWGTFVRGAAGASTDAG